MKSLTLVACVLGAMLLAPNLAAAGDRWSGSSSRHDNRGYRYDRGQRYNNHHSSSRSSYGFSFGFANSSWGDSTFLGFGYSRGTPYRGGWGHGGWGYGGWGGGGWGYGHRYPAYRTYDYCAPRYTYVPPPVIYRGDYYCSTPAYYSSPVVVTAPPRVYYPASSGTYFSGTAYYYSK